MRGKKKLRREPVTGRDFSMVKDAGLELPELHDVASAGERILHLR